MSIDNEDYDYSKDFPYDDWADAYDDQVTCHDYGIGKGCDPDCPVIWRGECEVIKEVIEQWDFDEDSMEELNELYDLTPSTGCKSIW